MNNISNYQANTIQFGELQDLDSLDPNYRDPYLRNVHTKNVQNINSMKPIHESEQKLTQHFDPAILGTLFRKKAMSKKTSQKGRFTIEQDYDDSIAQNEDLSRSKRTKR